MHDQDYRDDYYELSLRQRSGPRIRLLLQLYAWIGVLVATVASGYFLLTLLPVMLSAIQVAALIAGGVGALLAVMSRTLITFSRQRDAEALERAEEIERLASFLEVWTRFERVSKRALTAEQDNLDIHSFRSVISCLVAEGKIDKGDVVVLEEGLKTRNLIVHGAQPLSLRAAERITESLIEITRKIGATS